MHAATLSILTTEYDEHVLEKRFRLLNKCHNILLKRAKKLLRKLKRSKSYRKWQKLYADCLKRLASIISPMNKLY